MDDESSERLLPDVKNRKNDFRGKKFQGNKAANALFFGVVLGFVFSFLFAYSGIMDEDNNNINYSIYDFMSQKKNESGSVTETTNLAEFLYREVRVMCMVMTSADALKQRGQIIMQTWGKRCNRLLFFSESGVSNFTNIIVLRETDKLAKLREAMKYIYTNHLEDFDWILKTNDASFIILENLRYTLYQYESEWPIVLGQRFLKEVLARKISDLLNFLNNHSSKDYMYGDYAISKRAFARLLEDAFTNDEICDIKNNDDDKSIAACLDHINVIKIDGIDADGRGQFFHTNPEAVLFPERLDPNFDKWYWHKLRQGIEYCCSDRLIALQNYQNQHLFYLEYFIYKVHAFGRHRKREPLPKKLTLEEIVKNNY